MQSAPTSVVSGFNFNPLSIVDRPFLWPKWLAPCVIRLISSTFPTGGLQRHLLVGAAEFLQVSLAFSRSAIGTTHEISDRQCRFAASDDHEVKFGSLPGHLLSRDADLKAWYSYCEWLLLAEAV